MPRKIPIAVLRPQLPKASLISRYLERIDESRIYTNFGPLSREFEERICGTLSLPVGSFQSSSSGTAAIAGAILASAGRSTQERDLAIVPAFTFVATAVAIEQCGYTPLLVDVDAKTWLLNPETLIQTVDLSRVGVVVPIAAFGRPVPQGPWRKFTARTGIPVVIDGAASFDRLIASKRRYVGEIPVAVSFHATKTLSTGEGGGVITTDNRIIDRIAQSLNFGFFGSRESMGPSVNGKLSEYHAAVGLADLDGWTEKLAKLENVANFYRTRASEAGIGNRLTTAPKISACYVLFRADDAAQADLLAADLWSNLIDYRLWYERGLQHQRHFKLAPRGNDLHVTEKLAPCLLGLPVAGDLNDNSITRIVACLAKCLRGS